MSHESEPIPSPSPQNQSYEYSDVNQDMIDRAAKTQQAIGAVDLPSGPYYGRHSSKEIAELQVRGRLKYDPSINVDDLHRVDKMFREAHEENYANDVVASGGVDRARTGEYKGVSEAGIYEPGARTIASPDDSITGQKPRLVGAEWTNGVTHASRYGIDHGGNAYHDSNPIDEFATYENTTKHTFKPEHQAKARELVRSLADKQGERAAVRKRESNLSDAQAHIKAANTPKSEKPEIAA